MDSILETRPEPVANAELLRSLGRLVRGLSALFWGLPLALIVCAQTASARGDWLRSFSEVPRWLGTLAAMMPSLASTALLVYGLWQVGDFQKQERVWRNALDRARILSLVNLGLSPFVYWYNRIPANGFFLVMVLLLAFSGLLFLGSLNLVLQRLGAMLPDEALRLEIRQFTALNLRLLFATLLVGAVYFGLSQFEDLPRWLGGVATLIGHGSAWFLILLVLLPLAMTMALLWKTKEVILDNVFGAQQ